MSTEIPPTRPSRRGVVATAGGAALSTLAAGPAAARERHTPEAASPRADATAQAPGTVPRGDFDFTDGSAALTPDRTVATACQFCNANCRLHVDLRAGRIIGVRGEKNDPVQDGKVCLKADLMPELVYNETRLTSPLRRVAGKKGSDESRFEEIGWDEALRTIAEKLLDLRDRGEAHAIANRTTGRMPRGTDALVSRMFAMLGSPNDSDVGPVCNDAGGDALATTFGLGAFTNGYGVDAATGAEDLGAARHLLFLGTNQAETHPVTFEYLLRERRKTNATLTVVDPRLTPTGREADRWVAPKPHTDFALVLGMLHHVVEAGLYDSAFVDHWVLGFDALRVHLARHRYTPGWAAEVTGVPEATIVEMAEEYARAKPAAIFCNAGISHQLGAFDTYRVLAFLAAVTGNIGIPGGGCNFMHNTWPGALSLPELTVETPERRETLPVGPDYFAESILTGRPYRLKAVITQGNPLVASANSRKVREAFEKLDFYVYTGLFMEEPAKYADIILPVCSGLEMEGVYMRRDDRAIRWQDQVVPAVGDSKPDWEIWVELAHALARLDTKRPSTDWTNAFPREWTDYQKLWEQFVEHTPGMGGMSRERMRERAEPLRWPCPGPEHPGVSTLFADHPSWYEAAEFLDPVNKGKRFLTPSGKIEITTRDLDRRLREAGHSALPVFYTHPEVTGAHPTVRYRKKTFVTNPVNPHAVTHPVELGVPGNDDVHRRFPLMGVTGRPSVVHFAEVTHWTRTGKQLNGVRLVQIHPRTARLSGIGNGDEVTVESPRGTVCGTALLWEGIREDTVFVPNTFSPSQQVGDLFEARRYEPVNALPDDGYYDNLSGQQAYKCFACRVVKS
ncbi:molybdopterin-containing oxidoreductase family protein [Streptomyces sp. WMMC1477]|uniref:molybdopterin-containing oxidoreductase family protein n=1 Tax=Streptomyces sp. WMMC1477 TaxID=3015155 RepID=UPI0022B6950A|nr:molybdopterin-dependent oxidoreductase [Streptomyces sp. WMMC1477]MCZ7431121.1 molybdopterin-dependent oxidoreductase [Streptomyces sp. WMMC1477]